MRSLVCDWGSVLFEGSTSHDRKGVGSGVGAKNRSLTVAARLNLRFVRQPLIADDDESSAEASDDLEADASVEVCFVHEISE